MCDDGSVQTWTMLLGFYWRARLVTRSTSPFLAGCSSWPSTGDVAFEAGAVKTVYVGPCGAHRGRQTQSIVNTLCVSGGL